MNPAASSETQRIPESTSQIQFLVKTENIDLLDVRRAMFS